MFVIHGIFNSMPTERHIRNLTEFSCSKEFGFIHNKEYQGKIFDFTRTYNLYEKNVTLLNSFPQKGVILPPAIKIAEFYEKFSDFIIIRFPVTKPLTPATPLHFFEKTLSEFEKLKSKVLIELSGESIDFDMYTADFEVLNYNQAILRCAIKGSKTFFDQNSFYSYFTYLDDANKPHLVFTEDTKSISQKHNIIKGMKFKGICWKDVHLMSDGNWESLKGAYQNL